MISNAMRTLLLSSWAAAILIGAAGEMKAKGRNRSEGAAQLATRRIVDLGHALGPDNPPWPGDVHPFEVLPNASIEKDGYFTRKFASLEHFGTHLDAPAHFAKGGWTVEQIPVERLFGPAVLLDALNESAGDADYRLGAEKVAQWEAKHGRIPRSAIVLMRTGWSARWPDTARYRNTDNAGTMHFPGFSVEAVKLLIERGAAGLCIDTLSVDFGASKDFAVHHLSHGAGLYHVENLADLSAVPEAGATVLVAPIKLEGGSGAPARVFALLP